MVVYFRNVIAGLSQIFSEKILIIIAKVYNTLDDMPVELTVFSKDKAFHQKYKHLIR